MKKHILLLAGITVIFASCGNNESTNSQNQQAQIDSVSKANAALQEQLNQKKNDSTINVMAAAKADSMEKAAKEEHEKSGTKKTTKTTTTTTTQPSSAPAPAPGGMRAHSDQTKANQSATPASTQPTGGGMRAHSDQNKTK